MGKQYCTNCGKATWHSERDVPKEYNKRFNDTVRCKVCRNLTTNRSPSKSTLKAYNRQRFR